MTTFWLGNGDISKYGEKLIVILTSYHFGHPKKILVILVID